MEVDRPQQRQQPSRKGKKAWRKNIDIDDIEEAIEAKREDLRQLGTENIDELEHGELFTIDTTGDDIVSKKLGRDVKVLKSAEILSQRSKAPALKVERNERKKKIEGVSKKEVHRLMKTAGRVQGETQAKTELERNGIINTKAYDVWGDNGIKANKDSKKFSSKSWTKASKPPLTLQEKPISVKETEIIPHEGKSYNPSLQSWEGLINKEYLKEKENEDKRVALEKEKERIQELIKTIDDNQELSDSEAEQEDEDEINEIETTLNEKSSLSINPPVVNKQKTKAQRNKQKRNKQRLELENQLKSLKAQVKELEKIDQFEKEVLEKQKQKQEQKSKIVEEPSSKNTRRKKRLFKYDNINEQLEVKLSDELSDSLRKLKPEGNLLYDEMMKLQNKGMIESRRPVIKKRKYSPKITEKWTYKDFK